MSQEAVDYAWQVAVREVQRRYTLLTDLIDQSEQRIAPLEIVDQQRVRQLTRLQQRLQNTMARLLSETVQETGESSLQCLSNHLVQVSSHTRVLQQLTERIDRELKLLFPPEQP